MVKEVNNMSYNEVLIAKDAEIETLKDTLTSIRIVLDGIKLLSTKEEQQKQKDDALMNINELLETYDI